MTPYQTSLERLHDLVLPAEVSWWPLAPGWYALLVLVFVAAGRLAWGAWTRWRRDAYRREALRELQSLEGVRATAELLRRTALARWPRAVIANLTGNAWLDWLAAQVSDPMPAQVRRLLAHGIYSRSRESSDLGALRDYAALWIARHSCARIPADSIGGRNSE